MMGAMESQAVDVVVTGHVQGVFYRAAMREQADRLGVAGWVRNEADGTVRAHVEGSAEAVDELVRWCATGSRSAWVEDVQVTGSEPLGATEFEAR